MPVPSWLSSDPVEPKLPPRTRPGWAPKPNRKVTIAKAWQVPEGAGQDEPSDDTSVDYPGRAAPGFAPGSPPENQVADYIRQQAIARGIDPEVALAVANSEGGFDPQKWSGDQGSSYGPYQLHWGGVAPGGNKVSGIGDDFTAQTGIPMGDQSRWQPTVDFALDTAKRQGWDPKGAGFHGATRAGIGNWQGIGSGQEVPDFHDPLGATLTPSPVQAPTPPAPTPYVQSPAPQPQQPDMSQSAPTSLGPAQPVHQTEAQAGQLSLGQMQDLYSGLMGPGDNTDTSSTDTTDPSDPANATETTDLTDDADMSSSGSNLGPGPQPKAKGDWIDQARQAAVAEGIDPDVFARQIQQESGFNPGAKSPAGAIGIAQFMPDTAKGLGVDPTDPQASLKAAAKLDKQYLTDYGGDYRLMLAAYNAGPGAVAKYGGVPPYDETQSYVQDIFGSGPSKTPSGRTSGGGNNVISVAQTAIGQRYQYGGAGGRNDKAQLSPTDCSGFVSWAYQQGAGIKLPAQTQAIWDSTTAIDAAQAKPGDLVMFNMDTDDPHLQHVGIYLGAGQMLHDSSINPNGGVAVTNVWANPQFRRVPGATTEQLTGVSKQQDPVAQAQGQGQPTVQHDRISDWAVTAHAGRQVMMAHYTSGKTITRDLGKTAKTDGTVISSSQDVEKYRQQVAAQMQAQQPGQMGTGQEMGAGDDWYSDPSIDTAADDAPTPPAPTVVADQQDRADIAATIATPGGGYTVPTNADIVNATRAATPAAANVTYQDLTTPPPPQPAQPGPLSAPDQGGGEFVLNTQPAAPAPQPGQFDLTAPPNLQPTSDATAVRHALVPPSAPPPPTDTPQPDTGPGTTRQAIQPPAPTPSTEPAYADQPTGGAVQQALATAGSALPDWTGSAAAQLDPNSPVAQIARQGVTTPRNKQGDVGALAQAAWATGSPLTGVPAAVANQASYGLAQSYLPKDTPQPIVDALAGVLNPQNLAYGPSGVRMAVSGAILGDAAKQAVADAGGSQQEQQAAQIAGMLLGGIGGDAALEQAGATAGRQLDPLTGLPARLSDATERLRTSRQVAQADTNFATGGIAGGVARLITNSTAGEEAAADFAKPGELSRLPFDQLPNTNVLRGAEGVEPRPSGDGGGYMPTAKAPATPETADLPAPQRIRQVIADLVPNPRIPWTNLSNSLMETFLDARAAMQGRIASGEIMPESLVPTDLGTMGSIGRGATDFTKAFSESGLGEEGVQRLRPTFQTQTGPASATTRGLTWRPEISWSTTASDTTNPDIMAMITAIARPSVEEGTPLSQASFRTVAERQAAIDEGLSQLTAQQAAFGHGKLMSTSDLIAGNQLLRKGMRVGEAGNGWAETWPNKWQVLKDWANGTGDYAGMNPREATDKLLDDLSVEGKPATAKRPAVEGTSLRGLGQAKTRFTTAMSVNPGFATLDSRMMRDVFGLHPKAQLSEAEYKLLEQKLMDTPSASKYLYGKQWLPWEFLSGETTDYTSMTHNIDRVNSFFQSANAEAVANHETVGEAAVRLAGEQKQVPIGHPINNPDVVARIGVSPERVKDLPMGTKGVDPTGKSWDIKKTVPELWNFAKQSGVDIVGKPAVGAGGWLSDSTGRMYREGALDLTVRGQQSNVRFMAASWLAANPQEEAAMVVYHSGVPTDGRLATINIKGVSNDEAGAIEALATQHHPAGWTVRAVNNRGDMQLLLAAGAEDAEQLEHVAARLTTHLKEFGVNVSGATMSPAALEFIERSQVHDIIYGGPRGAYRSQGPGGPNEGVRGGGLAGYGGTTAGDAGPGAEPGAAGRPGGSNDSVRLEEGQGQAAPEEGLSPDEREAAIRNALPPEMRDTPAGQATVKQVAAAADPGPVLETLHAQGKLPVDEAMVDQHVPPVGSKRPVATRGTAPMSAAEQADVLQRAALDLNDQHLLETSKDTGGKHEPLAPQQVRKAIRDAVKRQNPGLGTREVTQQVDRIMNSRQTGAVGVSYALRLAGGVAGGAAGYELEDRRTAQDDPNRQWKLYAGAAVGAILGLGVPYLAGFVNKSVTPQAIAEAQQHLAPVLNRSPEYQKLHFALDGDTRAATLAGQLFTEKLDAAFRGQLDAAETSYWELHQSVSPKWQGNPDAVAAFKEWQDVARTGPKTINFNKTIDFKNPANLANMYVPHVIDDDWKAAQQVMPTSDVARASGGYSGFRQNPFWQFKNSRDYNSMSEGMADGVKYTDEQAKSLGAYKARVLQEKAIQDYAKGVKKLAQNNTSMKVANPELWIEPASKKLVPGATHDISSGVTLNDYLPGRLPKVRASREMADVFETTFGKSSGVGPLQKGVQQTLGAFGALKHNMFGLSGFHAVNVTRQFATSLPAMYAQYGMDGVPLLEHLPGANSQAAKWARFSGELLASPVRFGQEMAKSMAHTVLPGSWRAFKLQEAPGMIEASRDGLTLNMSTQHAMGVKRQVALSLFNAVGGGAAGYNFAQSQDMSPEQTLAFTLGGAIGGAMLGAHLPGHASVITNANDALFSRYIPYLKYRTYQLLKPTIGGRAAAEYANMSLGGQNLTAIARSRSVQDAARLVGLAPDFEEGVAKQWGNALFNWNSPQGTMNRMFWGSALVGSAFLLEAGNQAFGGHWSWDNDPSATLEWDMSRAYDVLGWNHTDPVTGQKYRPYFDFMGPWRGQFEAIQEVARASAMGAMQAYNIDPPDEIKGSVTKGIPHPDPIGALERVAVARAGLLPRSITEFASGTDYAGRPVEVAGDPALLNVSRRVVNAMQGALPTGPTQVVKGLETGQQGWGPAITSSVAGWVGFRTSRVSDSSRRLTGLDQWMKDNGVTPEIQAQLQDERAQTNQAVTDRVNALLADPNLTPEAQSGQSRSAGLISQIIDAEQGRQSEYKQLLKQLGVQYGNYDPDSGAPPPPGYEQQADDLKTLFGSVVQGGTDAAADLTNRQDVDANQLYQMAWKPSSTQGLPQQLLADAGIQAPDWLPNVGAKIDPNDQKAMAKEHAIQVQKVATDWDVDPAVMEDVVKSHLYGDGSLPQLPGMSSAALDDVASQYWALGQQPSGPDRTAAQQKVLSDNAAAYGVDANNLRQRVIWRGLPMTEQPDALKTYGNATTLDTQTQVYNFANPDGSPWGTLQQEKTATQLLAAARKQGRYVGGQGGFPGTYLNSSKTDVDPKLQALSDAQSRGTAAKAAALQKDPNYQAYDRYYGRGKYLTNDQWTQFQNGTLPGAFSDIGTDYPNEFKNRIGLLDKWATMTPEQRADPNQKENVPLIVKDDFTGQLSRINVSMAYAHWYLTNAKSAGKLNTANLTALDPDDTSGLPG